MKIDKLYRICGKNALLQLQKMYSYFLWVHITINKNSDYIQYCWFLLYRITYVVLNQISIFMCILKMC